MYYNDITKLPQFSPSHPHFLWDDVQLGKGSYSKDRMVKFSIGGKEEALFYRTCPCKGVKRCSVDYTVTLKARKPCPKHPKQDLLSISDCTVELTYLYLAVLTS